MKLLVVLAVVVASCAGGAILPVPRDNSHYVDGESRYIWMPDGEGNDHLVDLHAPVDEASLDSRNGANNQYWLFTRRNPTNHQRLVHNNINSVRNSNYASNRPLKVIVHGWRNNGNTAMNSQITSAFLAVQDCNVIVVDWRALANNPNYIAAANGVPNAGQFLGNFLVWLINNAGGNWNNVHLVGFSLGAHFVGNAGRQAGGRPARVTGLDPAGPNWSGNSNALNSNAGVYVEAIHTNRGALGINSRVANADFFPNGGNTQPGCSGTSCSHGRSTELFASSVRTNHFNARQCTNLQQAHNNQCTGNAFRMGNGIISKRGNGIFGLRTGSSWPF